MAADVDPDPDPDPDADVDVTLRLLAEGPPSVSRRTATGSVYLTREDPTVTLPVSDARRLANTSRWLVVDVDDAEADADLPTCAGADGACSRPVDDPGDRCWQHSDDTDDDDDDDDDELEEDTE